MKLELVYIGDKIAGYNLVPQNEEEKRAIGSIRHLYFFGDEDETPEPHKFQLDPEAFKYNGIQTDKANYVVKMMFLQKKHKSDNVFHSAEIEKKKKEVEIIPAPKYRCTLCHSVEVKAKLWDNPNHQGQTLEFSDDDDDRQNCWCNRCETHVPLEEIKQ